MTKTSTFACQSDGKENDVLEAVKSTGKTGPMAAYAIQGYSPMSAANDEPYNGRFFMPFGTDLARQYDAAVAEWNARKYADLLPYWPKHDLYKIRSAMICFTMMRLDRICKGHCQF